MLTMYNEAQFGVRSMQDGASEYLTKDNVLEELIKSLYQLRSGKIY